MSEWSNSSNSCHSSNSSIAPTDFNINNQLNESEFSNNTINDEIEDNSSIIDSIKPLIDENDSNNQNIINNNKCLLQCPVCKCDKSIFFCSYCIRNGDFTYSKQRFPERFAEKRLKYFKLKSEQNIISDKIDKLLKHYVMKDELEFKIRLIEANVENLSKSLINAKLKLENSEKTLTKSKFSQNECKERQNKLMSKVDNGKKYLIYRQNNIDKNLESKDSYDSYIKELVQQRVQQLTSYIFPIETKDSVNETNDRNSIFSSETTPLLTISESNNFNINYSVVEPWINGNGDYSSFALFASNDYPNRESNFRNPKHRICAALAYVTQLINIIAFYLDIRLPKRLLHSEFFFNNLNELQFAHKVAKLNANVLYLCLSQNINTELLNPKHTVKNLLHLLNSSPSLGIRNGPIVIRTDFLESIENSLLDDLLTIDETDVEDIDAIDNDHNDEELIEYDWVEHNLPDLHFNASGQQTSIAGGFMSTFASMWRAATGQKQ